MKQNHKLSKSSRQIGNRRLWLYVVVMALLSLAACSRETDTPTLPGPTSTTSVPLTATAAEDNPPQITATSTDAPPPAGQPIVKTSTRPPVSLDLVPCGVLLPVVAVNADEPSSVMNRSVVDIDRVPADAHPAMQRILSAPSTVGLVAFEVGKEEEGVYFNPDSSMPLASVTKIINLVAYAKAVEQGTVDPSAWIPIAEIERAYLPGSDLGSHRAAITELGERGLIASEDQSIPMEQVPWMMMRHSSNAASDYLQMLVGQEMIEETVLSLDLPSHTAPCPFIGQFLSISNHTRTGNDRQAVETYIDDPEFYSQEVMRLTDIFMGDSDFRENEGYWRAPVSVQRYFSDNLNPQASARDYARLMTKIMNNEIGSDYVNILVKRALEWPMIYIVNQQLFNTVGLKNGSLPGVLTIAYYGQRLVDGAQVVVVLFYRDLPMQTYRQWRQSQTHDELARWLLADPDGISTLRTWMEQAP